MPDAVTFKAENARLITRTSADRTGISDYLTKRDFRRDLDQDIRREGYDYFWPNTSGEFAGNPGGQPFPNIGEDDPTGEPITLVHLAIRPNGKHAVIVGTQTKLWRFFAMEEGEYFEGTGGDAYFENDNEDPENPDAYFASNSSVWELIGSGFSEDGHRWEALNLNGYTVFNNGVDLPVTFRLEESEVVPIYELREQGIAAVGTIGETNEVLMCGDISEIHEDDLPVLMRPVGDIDSENMTASQTATTVETPADFFTSVMVGRTIVWEDGTTTKITAFTDERTVTVNTSATVSNQRFTLRNKASQTGATYSGLISASSSGTTITADGAIFTIGMVGKTIRFPNGYSATIASFTSNVIIDVAVAPDEPIVAAPFWITEAASLVLVADSAAFDSGMVGRYIVFDTGEVRQIVAFTNSTTVTVDLDIAIASEFFLLDNPDSYAAFTDQSKIDRVHYRVIWAMPDEPRRFGVTIPGGIEEGSQTLTLNFPSQSFAVGDEIVIAGAGVSGGTLTATILNVSMLGQQLLLDQTAETTVEADDDGSQVIHSDAIGSIVGFEDLGSDSSGILRILKIGKDTVAIYKDTCIFTGFYTGLSDEPFRFDEIKIPEALTLHYRWTLIGVAESYHVYAGANSFYRFDLGAGVPRVIPELDLISDKFFTQVTLEDDDEIFSAENGVTNEIFIWFPSESDDKGLVYDYKHNSASTTSISMTAAATVKKPVIGVSVGATEDLFVMGNSEGTVLVYGLANARQISWGNVKEILYRRESYPFRWDKSGYTSALKSGWGDFGQPYHVKDLTAAVLYPASQSPDFEATWTLEGAKNPNSTPVVLTSQVLNSENNLKPCFFRQNYFRWGIEVTGMENPARVAAHTFEVEVVGSASHERRP